MCTSKPKVPAPPPPMPLPPPPEAKQLTAAPAIDNDTQRKRQTRSSLRIDLGSAPGLNIPQ